jgi:hypothetical protein
LKNVVVKWYGEFILEVLKKNLIKSIKIKAHYRYFNYVPIGHRNFDKHKKFISEGLLRIKFNYNLSKVHNYHLVKVSQKKNSQ